MEALTSGIRHRQRAPLSDPAWRFALCSVAAAVLFALVSRLPDPAQRLLLGPVALAGSWFTLRLLLLEAAAKRFWKWFFLIGAAGLVLSGALPAARVLVSIGAAHFLLFRRYSVLTHLGSRRRAGLFGLGILCFVLLVSARGPAEAHGWFFGWLHHAAGLGRFFLVSFWVMATLHLFLGIRLHFLRLRPKLAIVVVLMAALPQLLILSIGAVMFYSTLGSSRSDEAQDLMEEWRELYGAGALDEGNALGPGFADPASDPSAPAWTEDVAQALAQLAPGDVDPAIWFREEGALWLLRTPVVDGAPRLVAGRPVTEQTLTRLASHLDAEVTVLTRSLGDIDWGLQGMRAADGDSLQGLCARPSGPAVAGTQDPGADWSRRWIVFGAAPLRVYELDRLELERSQMFVNLRTRPVDLGDVFFKGDNDVNTVVAAVLIAMAFLFLLFQLLALYFGARIVGGMTGAVQKLHRGTQRLAEGDLDTWIEVPNEDEFGDLASSFNEMTAAIRLGQEQALQKERLEREVFMAREIQERLLPHAMPQVAGFEIAGSSEPSRYVGGDYFDFVPLPDGRLGIAIGDVTGKGVPAALLMSNLQATLHGQAMHAGPVAEQVRRMNQLLHASTDPHMFATFFYGVLDPAQGSFTAANAGHDPPLLMRKDGTLERVRSGGLILGMLPDQDYREETVRLDPGDVLVLYTDGITEAMGPPLESLPGYVPEPIDDPDDPDDPDGDADDDEEEEDDDDINANFFEEERLIEVVRREVHRSAEDIRRAVLEAVSGFTAGIPQSDDITLVVIKRTEALLEPPR